MSKTLRVREFGVGFLGIGLGGREILRLAQIADGYGFGTCWLAEDYFYRGAFSLASGCAALTSSIRIGIGAINPYTRHPALTAMELVGLAEVAGPERAILALGASNRPWIEAMGIPYAKPRRSLQEAMEIIRSMLKGESVTYAGQQFKLTEVKFAFAPPAKTVPLYLGVVGPKNLDLAGETADGVLLSVMTSPAYIRYAKEKIAAGAKKAHRDVSEFDVQAYLLFSIDRDRRKARERIKPFIGTLLGMAGFFGPDPLLTCTGIPLEEIKPLTDRALKGGDVSPLVSDWMLDTFTIAGAPDECLERFEALVEAGLTSAVAFETPGINCEDTINNLQQHFFPVFRRKA